MSYAVNAQMRTAVTVRIDELMQQATDLGWPVERPTISWSLRGTTAGKMGWCGTLYVNACILRENWDHYLLQTIGHEFAHHIVHGHFRGASAHGYEWKRVMIALSLPADRTHDYSVVNAQVKKKTKYLYTCNGCGAEVIMGPVRHKNQKAGYKMVKVRGTTRRIKQPYSLRHTCRNKDRSLVYVRILGQVTYEEARAAAERPSPKSRAPKPAPTGPKRPWKEVAVEVYGRTTTRAQFIATMVKLGLKKTTASTYHHNCKSGKWC